jgi:hypothetical protein
MARIKGIAEFFGTRMARLPNLGAVVNAEMPGSKLLRRIGRFPGAIVCREKPRVRNFG